MAYNYFPATYQPYQQGYYQPQQPTQAIIWIPSERDALAYPVAPNNAVTLWSQSEPVVYLKQADASGRPSMRTFDLVERKELKEPADVSGKSALAAVMAALEEVKAEIRGLRVEKEEKE